MINQLHIKDFVRASALAIIALVALASCVEPRISEEFKPKSDRDSIGRFCFEVDMSDSLKTYDITFYTRLDCGSSTFILLQDIPVNVEFVSPSGESFAEDVFLAKDRFVPVSAGTYDAKVDYRTGCVPVEYGRWNMNITVPEVRGMRGWGIVVSSKRL